MPFKNILLPVDGSEHAKAAGVKALDLAKLCGGSSVTMLYCLERLPSLIGGEARAELKKEMEKEARAKLEVSRKYFEDAGVKCSVEVREGAVADAILGLAEELKCDLIVMGSRGRSDFEGLVLGSVTHRVLQSAELPVLVVRG